VASTRARRGRAHRGARAGSVSRSLPSAPGSPPRGRCCPEVGVVGVRVDEGQGRPAAACFTTRCASRSPSTSSSVSEPTALQHALVAASRYSREASELLGSCVSSGSWIQSPLWHPMQVCSPVLPKFFRKPDDRSGLSSRCLIHGADGRNRTGDLLIPNGGDALRGIANGNAGVRARPRSGPPNPRGSARRCRALDRAGLLPKRPIGASGVARFSSRAAYARARCLRPRARCVRARSASISRL
jgi:hypothetical protein